MKTTLLATTFLTLFFAENSKAQWFQQTSGMSAPLSSIHCTDANTCMVAGTTSNVRKTTDGTNWVTVGSNGITNKLFVKMYSKDTIMMGQDNGTFKRTTNGGTAWSTDIAGGNINFDLFDIAYLSNTNFTAVGGHPTNHYTGGHITTSSTNTGASFPTFVNVSGEPTFFGIHGLTTTTFVACGGGASVYKTIDGGANWTAKLNSIPTFSTTTLYDINFPTATTGYAAGGNSAAPYTTGGTVYKTIDAGETWLPVGTGTLLPNTIFGIHFVNQDTGYVVGDGGKIQVTQNGGATWTAQTSPVTTQLNKIYFPTKNVGYICGAGGVILKTITGGFIPPISLSAGADVSICPGSCATLTATASGGVPPYSYVWSTAATTSSIVVCPTSTAGYTVTATDANATVAIDSVKVTVHINPTVSLAGLDPAYCKVVTSDTLIGTPMGGVYTGAGITAGDSVFNAFAAGVGSHTVTYTYVTAGGCTLTATQSTSVLAGAATVPLCLVTVDSTMANTQISVVWEPASAANIDSFRVFRNGTPVATVAASASTMHIDGGGITPKTQKYDYTLSTIDTCGLESAVSAIHSTIFLSPAVFNGGTSFSLTWTDYAGFTFSNYEVWRTINNGVNWTFVSNVPYIAANTYTDIAPSLSARYRIRATHPSACTVNGTTVFKYSLSNVTDDYTSVNELSLNSLVKVYPNPNHGVFHVELSGTGYEIHGLKIYNLLGEVVYQSSEKTLVSDITLPQATPGIYHLELITDKGVANQKIVIE